MGAERSGIHLTGADSGWPVGAAGEPAPHKDGTGADPFPAATAVADSEVVSNERQKVVIDATGGTADWTYDGQTAAAVSATANAAAVQAALIALSNIGPSDVVVSGGPGNNGGTAPYYVTFQGTLADEDVEELVVDDTNLTGGAASATVSTIAPA